MSPEKDLALRQKYPKIFKTIQVDNKTLDIWGFECEDGWFELIDTLCGKIQSHIDWRSRSIRSKDELDDLQVVAQQVKEKFGGLRFYTYGGDDITNAFISFAESMSMKICETCGQPGKQQGDRGWIHTACDPCLEKRSWRKHHEES